MSKRILSYYILILLFLTVSSCSYISHISHNEKEIMLQNNLNKWKTFRLDGIIEVNHKVFSFRKNLVLKKTDNRFRLDVFDSGVLGLSPAPFLSAYYDSLLILRLPGNSDLVETATEKLQEDFPYLKYFLNTDILLEHKAIILEKNQLQLNDITLYFSENMEIIKIEHVEKNQSLQIEYDNDPVEIIFFSKDKPIVDIIIDKITFSDVNIKAINQ
jgi:hypothetical protein